MQARAGLLSENMMKKRQLELQERAAKLQQEEAAIRQGLAAKEAEKSKDMLEQLDQFLAKYNQEKGYTYILRYTYGGQILLKDEAFNITEDVVAGLNEMYKDKKSGTSSDEE